MLSSPAKPQSLFNRMGGKTGFGPQPNRLAGFGQQQPQMGAQGVLGQQQPLTSNIGWSPNGQQQPGMFATQALGEDGSGQMGQPMGQPAQHPFGGITGGSSFGQGELDQAMQQYGPGGGLAQRSLLKRFGSPMPLKGGSDPNMMYAT